MNLFIHYLGTLMFSKAIPANKQSIEQGQQPLYSLTVNLPHRAMLANQLALSPLFDVMGCAL